jgi:hypothetical protein
MVLNEARPLQLAKNIDSIKFLSCLQALFDIVTAHCGSRFVFLNLTSSCIFHFLPCDSCFETNDGMGAFRAEGVVVWVVFAARGR